MRRFARARSRSAAFLLRRFPHPFADRNRARRLLSVLSAAHLARAGRLRRGRATFVIMLALVLTGAIAAPIARALLGPYASAALAPSPGATALAGDTIEVWQKEFETASGAEVYSVQAFTVSVTPGRRYLIKVTDGQIALTTARHWMVPCRR